MTCRRMHDDATQIWHNYHQKSYYSVAHCLNICLYNDVETLYCLFTFNFNVLILVVVYCQMIKTVHLDFIGREIFFSTRILLLKRKKNSLTHLREPESVESFVEYLQQRNL